jgi:hypothetical protein
MPALIKGTCALSKYAQQALPLEGRLYRLRDIAAAISLADQPVNFFNQFVRQQNVCAHGM